MKLMVLGSILLLSINLLSCSESNKATGEHITIEFNQSMHTRVLADFSGSSGTIGDFTPSEYVMADGKKRSDFLIKDWVEEKTEDEIGSGIKYTVSGKAGDLTKQVDIVIYDRFPDMAVFQVTYKNMGTTPVNISSWTNNNYHIKASQSNDGPAFWSFQSGSYENRPDWVLPLKSGFEQKNYMGMNASDYGGGTPVVDIWRRDVGIGVGHVELVPKLVSLPVTMPDEKTASLGVTQESASTLKPNEAFTTLKTFVIVHQGDYYKALAEYSRFMQASGISFDEPQETSYEAIWCAWGYERDFTMDQIYNTLPKVKELGYEWAVLDDGYHTAEGDWHLLKDKFPRGDRDMQDFVKKINSYGLKAKLWWAPLAVDPGTDLIREHPEYLLINEDGSYQDISWWDSYYLCPAYAGVQEYTKDLVKKIMTTWGYAGLKIDGQHLNGAPPCYNQAHNHAYPEEAVEKVPEFFKVIYETALAINPQAVVEICPCGTAYAFHTMPYMNQPVSSDPMSSWQIRLKGKTLKALMGPSTPYYGDHVELSDQRSDFASTVGIGGVVGTKFTWPVGAKKDSKIDLTVEKEKLWKKWLDIYRSKMLPKGIYEGELYDIGFDKPEAHAVRKGDRMYYAFYADTWDGDVELRGLSAGKSYEVLNYVEDKNLGTVTGPVGNLKVAYSGYLLLEVAPQ